MKTPQTTVLDTPEATITVERLLQSMKSGPLEQTAPAPIIKGNFEDGNENVSTQMRFISSLAAVLKNIDQGEGFLDRGKLQELIGRTSKVINDQINEIIHQPKFQELEATWTGLFDLLQNTNFRANIMIDILDVSKAELGEDFQNNAIDFTGSAFFQKVYFKEYDQYGGKPYGAIVGLYEFDHTPEDLRWLKIMGKVANASHAPFIGNVSCKFFGWDTIEELAEIKT